MKDYGFSKSCFDQAFLVYLKQQFPIENENYIVFKLKEWIIYRIDQFSHSLYLLGLKINLKLNLMKRSKTDPST